jgi:hypothetical protein
MATEGVGGAGMAKFDEFEEDMFLIIAQDGTRPTAPVALVASVTYSES